MLDNTQECRVRLLKIASFFEKITLKHIEVIWGNIVCADSLKYDFEFDKRPTLNQCQKILDTIKERDIFARVNVPEVE